MEWHKLSPRDQENQVVDKLERFINSDTIRAKDCWNDVIMDNIDIVRSILLNCNDSEVKILRDDDRFNSALYDHFAAGEEL